MNFYTCLITVTTIFSFILPSIAFSAVPMNRINAYRQMLPADFDVGTMPSLRPIPENNISPPRFGQFGFPIYGNNNNNLYSNSLLSAAENGGDFGIGGTKRAKLFRLANQAARGFGK